MGSGSRWLRYGNNLPEALENSKIRVNAIQRDSQMDRVTLIFRCFMYYLDMVLDLLIAVKYIEDGDYEWAAVTLGIFSTVTCFNVLQMHHLAIKHDLSVHRTPVFMLPWNAFRATDETPEEIDTMVSIQLNAILDEGLFEAPSQLLFQLFVVMFLWGFHGSPENIQLGSIVISIMSLGMSNVSTFDEPYIYLGKKSIADISLVPLVPYVFARGFQLMYRVISLALLLLVFGIWYGSLCLLPLICLHAYLLQASNGYSSESARQSTWLLDRFPLMRKIPPLSVLIGSMFSDGFFGDVHFRDHLPSNNGRSSGISTRAQVAPHQQQDDQQGEDYSNDNNSDSRSSCAGRAPHFVIRKKVPKKSFQKVEPSSSQEQLGSVVPTGGGEKTAPELTKQMMKDESDERRRARRAQKSLIVSESEVCAEVKTAVWGILLIAVESWLCFAVAFVSLDRFEVDKFVIGWMALTAGGCMLIRAVLHWVLFYFPLKEVPRRAVPVVRGAFVAYMLLAMSIMGVALVTGIAPDDCFNIDCGVASQCIPLTGAYQCDCTEGRSEKEAPDATPKDVCIDINECLVGTHTCIEDHLWCINTDGFFECGDCGEGTYASDDGQCTVKMCFSSGKLMPGQHKISSTQETFTGFLDDEDFFGSSVAVLGDLDKDGVMDMAVGAYRDDDGSGDNSGAVYVAFMGKDGSVKSHQKISATQGGLVGPLGAGDEFGNAVAGLGDLDKDGVEDMVVGAHHDGDIWGQAGAVYVVFLYPNGTAKAEQKISGAQGRFTGHVQEGGDLGRSAAGMGDVNGDGIVDLVMGSRIVTEGPQNFDPSIRVPPTTNDEGGAIFVVMLEADGTVKGYQMTTFLETCNQFDFRFSVSDEWAGSLANMGDLDGDGVPDIAVGAPGDAKGGSVYLLMLSSDGTTKDARKIGSGHGGLVVTLGSSSYFGSSVAPVGDLNGDGTMDMAVGAAHDDDGGSGRGSIYVLLLASTGTVVHEQKISSRHSRLIGDPLDDQDYFGWGLASGGDWDGDGAPDLLVGAYGDDAGGPDRGAVYLLEVPPGFVSPCSGNLTCVDTGPGSFSCVEDANECLVSVDNGGCEQLCYGHAGGGTSCDCEAGFVLGSNGTCTAGSITCTTGVLMPWEQKLSSDSGGGPPVEDHDWFGFSVARLGDVDGDGVTDAVVGAPSDSLDGIRRGAVYVLLLHPTGTVKHDIKISSSMGGLLSTVLKDYDTFGASVAGLGDMNGDGVPDMVVGAPRDDAGGGTNRGAVYVLFLTAGGAVKVKQKISAIEGGLVGPLYDRGEFGSSVATVGDLNGDGVVDVAVGARFDDDGGFDRGAVYVLLMRANGTVAGEQKISSTQGGLLGPLGDGDQFGSAVAGVGDVDRDGVADLVVGAPYDDGNDGGGLDRGGVYVLLMRPSGTVKGEQKISSRENGGLVSPLSNHDLFGGAMARVGDLDGDGVVDVVVGASHDDDGGVNHGAVYVILLHVNGTVKAEGKISSTQGGLVGPLDDGDLFGISVGYLSDLNGDGVVELVVGAAGDDDGSNDGGAVYVLKVPTGFVAQQCNGGSTGEEMCSMGGSRCASPLEDTTRGSLCDWNNGGCEQQCLLEGNGGDFVFCSCNAGFIRNNKDESSCIVDTLCHPGVLVPGMETKISSKLGGLESPLSDSSGFGTAVASIGDLDGDGVEDLVVGTPFDEAVHVLFLYPTGAVKTHQRIDSPLLVAEEQIKIHFGAAVAGLGDMDGDGVVDLVVGAPGHDLYFLVYGGVGGGWSPYLGALYVLLMHADGTVKREQQQIVGGNDGGGGSFGFSVAVLGDLDRDGVTDIVTGAPLDRPVGGRGGGGH